MRQDWDGDERCSARGEGARAGRRGARVRHAGSGGGPLGRTELRWLAIVLGFLAFTLAPRASAAPQAHILRISPLASIETGQPIITTLVEIVETERTSELTADCASATGERLYACMAAALQSKAGYRSFKFPGGNAALTVQVEDSDQPATFVSDSKWGDSKNQPGVGTAWLVMIDAGSKMPGLGTAREVARELIAKMGPNDLVNVMFFNDTAVFKDSRWLPTAKRADAVALVDSVKSVTASAARSRRLATILEQGVNDAFESLGNSGSELKIPLHQALVLLSSGYGGADPATTGLGGRQVREYLTDGRFPKANTALPKTPLPVVALWFPPSGLQEFTQNSLDFMQSMANPEIGGFFTPMLPGQGADASKVVGLINDRFAGMYIVKWRVACLAPKLTQTFQLVFRNLKTPIAGDNTFKDVPIGIDPSAWPLDINRQATLEEAQRTGGVHPGGRFRVYGTFCWGGDKNRAEVFFIPAGQELPKNLSSTDLEAARQTQQQLIKLGMRGVTLEANAQFADFEAPDTDDILLGSGKNAVVRLVLYDNKAHRTSGLTAEQILELPAGSKPFPVLWAVVAGFGLIVLVLLVLIVTRSRPKHAPPPPAPVIAGGMPGFPGPGGFPGAPGPQGGAGQPPGAPLAGPYAGGYGAAVAPQGPTGMALPVTAPDATPPPGGGFTALQPVAGEPPRAPAGHRTAPGVSPFAAGPGAATGHAPLPAVPMAPMQPPLASAQRLFLNGMSGAFALLEGAEVRAGRDPAQCAVLLTDGQISAVHATLRVQAGQLYVRDEGSNNGTAINGLRVVPGVWNPVPLGAALRFGPVEFALQLG